MNYWCEKDYQNKQPAIHKMVLVVASVQKYSLGILQETSKKNDNHFDGLGPSVDKISIE